MRSSHVCQMRALGSGANTCGKSGLGSGGRNYIETQRFNHYTYDGDPSTGQGRLNVNARFY
jgi:hypothetical protein